MNSDPESFGLAWLELGSGLEAGECAPASQTGRLTPRSRNPRS